MSEPSAAQRLHQILRYTPERQRIDVSVQPTVDGISVTATDTALSAELPDANPAQLSLAVSIISNALRYYPVPAFVNGQKISRHDWPPDPAVSRTNFTEPVMATYSNGAYITEGLRYSAILVDGVLYQLHMDYRQPQVIWPALVHEYEFALDNPRHPQYSLLRRYSVSSHFRWDAAADPPVHYRFHTMTCTPPPDTIYQLHTAQNHANVERAAAIVRADAGVSELPPPRFKTPRQQHDDHYYAHSYNAAYPTVPLAVHGQPVLINRSGQSNPPAMLAIADALYRGQHPYVPVTPRPGRQLPDVTASGFTVVHHDGSILEIAGSRHCVPRTEPRPGPARSLTAHLLVQSPDAAAPERYDLPLDILPLGEWYEPWIQTTDAWTAERHDDLKDLLFNVYCDYDDQMSEDQQDRLANIAETKAVRILEGRRRAIATELQQFCNALIFNYHDPLCPGLLAQSSTHTLIWQPRRFPDAAASDADLAPPWVTAAVMSANPQAERDSVLAKADALWNNPESKAQLRQLLQG